MPKCLTRVVGFAVLVAGVLVLNVPAVPVVPPRPAAPVVPAMPVVPATPPPVPAAPAAPAALPAAPVVPAAFVVPAVPVVSPPVPMVPAAPSLLPPRPNREFGGRIKAKVAQDASGHPRSHLRASWKSARVSAVSLPGLAVRWGRKAAMSKVEKVARSQR